MPNSHVWFSLYPGSTMNRVAPCGRHGVVFSQSEAAWNHLFRHYTVVFIKKKYTLYTMCWLSGREVSIHAIFQAKLVRKCGRTRYCAVS